MTEGVSQGPQVEFSKPVITLEFLAKLNEHDEVGKVLDWLTRNGELRDYDDEIANRIEDAKTIVRGVMQLRAEEIGRENAASWPSGPTRRKPR